MSLVKIPVPVPSNNPVLIAIMALNRFPQGQFRSLKAGSCYEEDFNRGAI